MNDPDALQRITRLPISREECLGKAKELMEAVRKARAINPDFDDAIALMHDRARLRDRARMLEDDIESITRQIEEIKTKLSPEERELL